MNSGVLAQAKHDRQQPLHNQTILSPARLMLASGFSPCGSTHISPTSSERGCRMRMPAGHRGGLLGERWSRQGAEGTPA